MIIKVKYTGEDHSDYEYKKIYLVDLRDVNGGRVMDGDISNLLTVAPCIYAPFLQPYDDWRAFYNNWEII